MMIGGHASKPTGKLMGNPPMSLLRSLSGGEPMKMFSGRLLALPASRLS
jgi:hypothetical protein